MNVPIYNTLVKKQANHLKKTNIKHLFSVKLFLNTIDQLFNASETLFLHYIIGWYKCYIRNLKRIEKIY